MFTPDTTFCANSIVREVTILRKSTVEEYLEYVGCIGDGHIQIVNGTSYHELNPTGQQIFNTNEVCDSVVNINLIFNDHSSGLFTQTTCSQSGYSITINSTVYDETNPNGIEVISNALNCDSTLTIDLEFLPILSGDVMELFCAGSGDAIIVNGTLYDEFNPVGSETIASSIGCDSVININLSYLPVTASSIDYQGCYGDGYSVVVNSTVYDELNTTGSESMQTVLGCDSIIFINLIFNDTYAYNETYSGCIGDGYTIVVNNVTYDENNPIGVENLPGSNGCDTVVVINLEFNSEITSAENYSGCIGDGYSISVNNVLYNESNPNGEETMQSTGGCDSIVTIALEFNSEIATSENYSGCIGDGYSISVNNVIYNESNASGQETMQSASGCDSIVTVELEFNSEITTLENYSGCTGDGYSITVNNVLYNETNASGQETMQSASGCDSIVTVELEFNSETTTSENYSGCTGDGYSITVNNVLYNESNANGEETMQSTGGCDSIVTIALEFNSEIATSENYSGCIGDGYSISVNNVIYNESNASGQETMQSASGCDSIVTVELEFNSEITTLENYSGCTGDGYSITVNNGLYNETNASGQETMQSASGCDSIVTVELEFNSEITTSENYSGCLGDGYSISVNNVIYNESNASGQETMLSSTGCDSIVTVDLEFNSEITTTANYSGCLGDGYSISVNNVVYNESNASGQETMLSSTGCDSIVTVDLEFNSEITTTANYSGCLGDGYSISVNNVLYNETNSSGLETMQSASGCDSIVTIDLEFNIASSSTHNYSGCQGDNYSISINNVVYDESNPNGTEILQSTGGCDSIIAITLEYAEHIERLEQYQGCTGDGYAVEVNNTIYDENNPTAVETMVSASGCDSIVIVELEFHEMIELDIQYTGCQGDQYFYEVNDVIYNEENPNGFELLSGDTDCDTLASIELVFLPASEQNETIYLNPDDNNSIDISQFVSHIDSITNIHWSPSDVVSCSECIVVDFIGNENTSMTVTVQDGNNCTHLISLNIVVIHLESSLFIPSVFSPNNDGINEYFGPLTNSDNPIEIISFAIFNRWGDRVFHRENLLSNDVMLGWDGTIKGRPVSEGVYVYQLEVNTGTDGIKLLLGDVTLVR